MKLSRRVFLIGAASLPLTYLCGKWVAQDHSVDLIVSILRKQLNYLNVSSADLIAFAQDLVQANEVVQSAPYPVRLLGLLHPFYFELTAITDQMAIFESRLVTRFLSSTDFFWKGSDITQVVTYQGLLDPYQTPCTNPFRQYD